jgi:predicted SnoaL-like aldol condensation-catalyzing enzyme
VHRAGGADPTGDRAVAEAAAEPMLVRKTRLGVPRIAPEDVAPAVHLEARHDLIPRYFSGDRCVRHEPGAADGVGAFMRDLQFLTRDRTINEIKLLLGQGHFVFLAARGTHWGEPCVYIDLYRVEDAKLVEHWGFPVQAPWPEARKVQSFPAVTISTGHRDGH